MKTCGISKSLIAARLLVRWKSNQQVRHLKSAASWRRSGYWLHVARSPECGIDLDMLSSLEQDSRNPKEDVERQRKTMAEKCPSLRLKNRWLVLRRGTARRSAQCG